MDSPMQTLTLYDQDFSLWVEAQVSALKTQRYDELDLSNLLEELESLTRRDRRSLKSHLRVLLMHLLKWQFQLQKRTVSWQVTIANARQNIADI
jgi:predicted DNA-binding ribbon-helix-helix protein